MQEIIDHQVANQCREAMKQSQDVSQERDTVGTPVALDKMLNAYTKLALGRGDLTRAETIEVVLLAYKLITENHKLRERIKTSVKYIIEQELKQNKRSFAGRF